MAHLDDDCDDDTENEDDTGHIKVVSKVSDPPMQTPDDVARIYEESQRLRVAFTRQTAGMETPPTVDGQEFRDDEVVFETGPAVEMTPPDEVEAVRAKYEEEIIALIAQHDEEMAALRKELDEARWITEFTKLTSTSAGPGGPDPRALQEEVARLEQDLVQARGTILETQAQLQAASAQVAAEIARLRNLTVYEVRWANQQRGWVGAVSLEAALARLREVLPDLEVVHLNKAGVALIV